MALLCYDLLPFVYFHSWILSDAYLQNYISYGYEILWVERSHQAVVQCPCCLLNFWVIALWLFYAWILSGAYLQDYTSYGYEILWVDRSHQGGVQCTWTVPLALLFLSYCPLSILILEFIFILEFCPVHISKTILAMVMKFCMWIDLIKGECIAHEL